MKKIILITFSYIFIIVHITIAQNRNVMAQEAYLKGEAHFFHKDYENALKQMLDAEKYLGETNSKILYLKINILKQQFKNTNINYKILADDIAKFFSITKKQIFPSEKYLEIVTIKTDLEDFVKKDRLASEDLLNSGNIESISAYLSETPYTFYLLKLDQRRQSLYNIRHLENEKQQIYTKLNNLETHISVEKIKDSNQRFWGGMAFLLGGYISWAVLIDNSTLGGGKLSDSSTTSGDLYGSLFVGVIGTIAAVEGAVFLLGGGKCHRQIIILQKERDELIQKKRQLSFSADPFYNKSFGSDIVGLKLKICF